MPSSVQDNNPVNPCVASATIPPNPKDARPAAKKPTKRSITYLDDEDEVASQKEGAKRPKVTTEQEAKPVPVMIAAEAVPAIEGAVASHPVVIFSPQQKSRLEPSYRIPKLSVSPDGAGVVVKQEKIVMATKQVLQGDSPSRTSGGTASLSSSGGRSDCERDQSSSTPTERGKPGGSQIRGNVLPGKPVKQLFTSPAKPSKADVKPVSKSPQQAKPAKPASDVPNISRGSSYHSYLARGGPKAPGSKPIPEGKEDCLEGLVFVISGVLESLEREEASDLIKKYGGKVTQSISKKTSYMVVGEEAGEAKLAKVWRRWKGRESGETRLWNALHCVSCTCPNLSAVRPLIASTI